MRVHDVLVVGGGAAGLSAAVTLSRSLRSVLVVDAGAPRNAPAHGAHNLLGREGINPLDLLAAGRAEAQGYGAEVIADQAVTVTRTGGGFTVGLASGTEVAGRHLLLASGLVDVLPDVPGLVDLWGDKVLHCPYCHGYEVRGRRIGILATWAEMVSHQALLFRQVSDQVTLFLHELPEPEGDQLAMLRAAGVELRAGRVEHVEEVDGSQVRVELADGTVAELDAVAVQTRMLARADLYEQLGGSLTDHPAGGFIESDHMGRTALGGVWAAGNASNLSAMVGMAAAEGTMAGAAINAELVMADARAAAGL